MNPAQFLIAALAGSVALSAAVAASAEPTVINVQLSEYKFTPAEIDLRAGETYVLHVTNTGGKSHDLSAKDFFRTVGFGGGSAAKAKDGDIDVDQGESTDVTITPQKPGSYEMHCTKFMHSMLGMKGQIVVR